jgi:hypothetical protein
MTKQEVLSRIEAHNQMIDNFINIELKARLKLKGDKMNLSQWFDANTILNEQNFFGKGMEILNACKAEGYVVKINGQSNKLELH